MPEPVSKATALSVFVDAVHSGSSQESSFRGLLDRERLARGSYEHEGYDSGISNSQNHCAELLVKMSGLPRFRALAGQTLFLQSLHHRLNDAAKPTMGGMAVEPAMPQHCHPFRRRLKG